MDNQPVTTRRAILIQDFDDGTYGERLFTGDRTPDTREKAARLKTGRLYPIPDDADIYAVVLTDGTCASSPTRPDAEMRAYGFTDHVPEEWYLCRKVSEDGTTTLNLTIAKDGSDWVIDVLDEYFLQPYDYQGLLKRNPDNGYARAVADECERQYRLLTEAGILTGWHEGMYV